MMYDGKTLQSFTERAMKNYKQLIKSETEYDITIALCTLCGVLSIIDQYSRQDIFSDFHIPSYVTPTKCKLAPNDMNNISLAIIRHFRNSLCHFKLDGKSIKSNDSGIIEKIVFKDVYKGKLQFSCTLKADQIKQFLITICDHIIKHN